MILRLFYISTLSTILLLSTSSFASVRHSYKEGDYKNCIIENYQKIELCLIETFSKQWYDDLCEQDQANQNRFYFHIIADQNGRVISIEKDRLFKGMSNQEFNQFAKHFKNNFNICIFPPRGTSMEDFKKKHGNNMPFSFLYFPRKTRIFLEDWRLKNG